MLVISKLKNLRRIKPRHIFLMYLLSILFFAAMYSMIPNQFYHSTAKYETTQIDLKKKLESEIGNALFNKYKINLNNLDSQPYLIKEVAVRSIAVEKDSLTKMSIAILLANNLQYESKKNASSIEILDIIDIYFDKNNVIKISDKNTDDFILCGNIMNRTIKNFSNQIFNDLGLDKISYEKFFAPLAPWPDDVFGFRLSLEGYKNLIDFVNGENGFPNKDIFVRMLYLSAITITTLGFGDIIPITTLARLLVTFESVWGIVILGLFINKILPENS